MEMVLLTTGETHSLTVMEVGQMLLMKNVFLRRWSVLLVAKSNHSCFLEIEVESHEHGLVERSLSVLQQCITIRSVYSTPDVVATGVHGLRSQPRDRRLHFVDASEISQLHIG